jgi:hypothetical protein
MTTESALASTLHWNIGDKYVLKDKPELFIFGNPCSIPVVCEVKKDDNLHQ